MGHHGAQFLILTLTSLPHRRYCSLINILTSLISRRADAATGGERVSTPLTLAFAPTSLTIAADRHPPRVCGVDSERVAVLLSRGGFESVAASARLGSAHDVLSFTSACKRGRRGGAPKSADIHFEYVEPKANVAVLPSRSDFDFLRRPRPIGLAARRVPFVFHSEATWSGPLRAFILSAGGDAGKSTRRRERGRRGA